MSRSIITLTTDFGLADHYVAVMKGVIAGIAPRAQIVDISHQISPFAIAEAAYLLAQAYAYFPDGTTHVAVVDPGVGSARRALLMEAAGQYFIGPDNGIFSIIAAREKHKTREITNARFFRRPVSATFHGRDIFAPVGAHIAAGVAPVRLGKRITDDVALDLRQPQALHIDHFGNVVTNLPASDLPRVESLSIGGTAIAARVTHYAEAAAGTLFLIAGSGGYIEISINGASAAERLGIRAGAAITPQYF